MNAAECVGTSITLGELFREDRIERGLTQKQAADEIGISREYYAKIESGKITNPTYRIYSGLFRRKVRIVAAPCRNQEPHRHFEEKK